MAAALTNLAKTRLKDGEAICGFGITMAAPAVAQVLSRSGADFLNVDLEHGSIDLAAAHSIIAATAGTTCTPIVRVSTAKSWAIKPVLDAGALGIVLPMVRARSEVESGFAAALYPPTGTRGIGPHHAPARWGVSAEDYIQQANDAMLKMVLIETREALEGIDDILRVPGLDVVTIAIGDLAASLGVPPRPDHPKLAEAIRAIEGAVLASGVALGGVATSPEDVRRKRDAGYRVLVLGFDVALMRVAATQWVAALNA